jgi:hypothetical protein
MTGVAHHVQLILGQSNRAPQGISKTDLACIPPTTSISPATTRVVAAAMLCSPEAEGPAQRQTLPLGAAGTFQSPSWHAGVLLVLCQQLSRDWHLKHLQRRISMNPPRHLHSDFPRAEVFGLEIPLQT